MSSTDPSAMTRDAASRSVPFARVESAPAQAEQFLNSPARECDRPHHRAVRLFDLRGARGTRRA